MNMLVDKTIPFLLRVLLKVSRNLPPLWRTSGISNRIIKPFWCVFGHGKIVLPVWPPIRMRLDPCEVVGGNLAFIPQLYDRWERKVLRKHLPLGGVFVDVGSNIGAYAFWAATCVGPNGKILALEADPENYALLQENVALNEFDNVIMSRLGGVADKPETLRFYKNTCGNRGGHSFIGSGDGYVEIQCETLATIINASSLNGIDVMKLDIEGFEERVLRQYFSDIPELSPLRPKYLLVEINGGPIQDGGARQRLKELICQNGYELLVDKGNSWFRKISAP